MQAWPLLALTALVLLRCAVWPPSTVRQRNSAVEMDDDRPWVTVTDLGRLGNQMSEYASLLAIAKDFNWRPYISTLILLSCPGDQHQADDFEERKHSALSKLFPGLSVATASPGSAGSTGSTAEYDVGVITANSLQRGDRIPVKRKYLLANVPKLLNRITRYRSEILREFTLGDRSDYVDHLKTMLGADIFDPHFYSRAINKTLEILSLNISDVHIVVASDEPTWCKENLPLSAFNVSFTSDYYRRLSDPIGLSMAFDLGVMSNCDHVVYDYGTFGFWCAFMCAGKGFTPEVYPNSNKIIRLVKEIKSASMINGKFHFI